MSLPALGRCYTLNYNVALGIDALTDGLWVSLNPNMSYYINLHESSFFSITTNKLAMPTSATHMSPATGNSPQRGFLFTLEVSRRKNINRIEAPCKPSHNYNFTECVLESKAKMIGCTLPWNMKISGSKMYYHTVCSYAVLIQIILIYNLQSLPYSPQFIPMFKFFNFPLYFV